MKVKRLIPSLLLLVAAGALPTAGQAAVYTVGPGCSHTNLQAALTAAAGTPSSVPHQIRITGTEYQIVDVDVSNPKADMLIEGGYANCTAASSTGVTTLRKPAAPVNGNILSFSNGVSNPRRTITLRNLTLTGARDVTFGALNASGHLTVVLKGAVTIRDNEASGIYLLNLVMDKPTRLQMEGEANGLLWNMPAIIDNSNRFGAGIHATGSEVTLYSARIAGNTATVRGGGIALSSSTLKIIRAAPLAVTFQNNTAMSDTFNPNSGLGGAIYGTQSSIETNSNRDGYQSVQFIGNEANHGGAVYLTNGNTTTRKASHFKSSQWINNKARGKGGAIHIVNGIDLTVEHTQEGGMCRAGQVFFLPGFPDTPVHCSRMIGNIAGNMTTGSTPGGGAIYVLTEVDAPAVAHAKANIYRTVFEDNKDLTGYAAAIASLANTQLTVSASVFRDNHALMSGSVIEGRGPYSVVFDYNTVLDNQTGFLIFGQNQTLYTRGSILWAPGKTIVGGSGSTHDHGSCLITSSALTGAVINVNPRLDDRFRPRGSSPAIDECASLVVPGLPPHGPTIIPPIPDLYYKIRDYDVAGVANNGNAKNDLGAVEQVDIIYYGGFGTKPHN